MAVTAGAQRVGRASAQVLVRDPLVLQTTLPRFLTQRDDDADSGVRHEPLRQGAGREGDA